MCECANLSNTDSSSFLITHFSPSFIALSRVTTFFQNITPHPIHISSITHPDLTRSGCFLQLHICIQPMGRVFICKSDSEHWCRAFLRMFSHCITECVSPHTHNKLTETWLFSMRASGFILMLRGICDDDRNWDNSSKWLFWTASVAHLADFDGVICHYKDRHQNVLLHFPGYIFSSSISPRIMR